MPVYFNYFEELSENKFLLKHLDQAELYLVIEYDSEPTFFLLPDRSLSFEIQDQSQGHSEGPKVQCPEESRLFTLKSMKNYFPLSQKIAQTNPVPWGAYLLSLSSQHHTYHFVYEILDPQGQALTTAQFEKVFQKSHPQSGGHPERSHVWRSEGSQSDFLKTRLYEAYQNLFSEKSSLGELQTGALRNIKLLPRGQEIIPVDHCLRFPLRLNDPFRFSATLDVYNIKLFPDHFEKNLIPKESSRAKPRVAQRGISGGSEAFTIRIGDMELKNIRSQEHFVFDRGKLKSYLASELEILLGTTLIKKYKILIRNGRPKEKIWDSSPLPFEKLSSLRWDDIPSIVRKNMLEAYHEDDDLFWGITNEPNASLHYSLSRSPEACHPREGGSPFVYFLPLNFYYALTLQRLKWPEHKKEPPFQRYIDNSLKTISFAYYLYENDPRYSEWFHRYIEHQLGFDGLLLKLKDKHDELYLKPQNIWSSIDAMECLNACYVAEHEKHQDLSKIALDFLKLFQKRLETEHHATASHARLQEKKRIQTCSPQGLAVLAMLKGFEHFQEASFKKRAQDQLEFLLKSYPIEEQTFIPGKYDTSALVNTTAALQKATQHFPEYKKVLEKAKQRILDEWVKQSPFLPLSTQLEVAELIMTDFYGYF